MFDCPDSLYDASCACTINLHTCIIKKKNLHEYFETMNVAHVMCIHILCTCIIF